MVLFIRTIRKNFQFQRHVEKEKQDGLPQFEKYVEKKWNKSLQFQDCSDKRKVNKNKRKQDDGKPPSCSSYKRGS